MNKPDYIRQTTYLTLTAAAIGAAGYTLHYSLWLLYLPVALLPIYHPFGLHSPAKMLSITLTTFVFGLINANSYIQLRAYFSSSSSEPPTLCLYLSLVTIYHYFQFQLVNNFHYQKLAWQNFLIYHSKHYTIANCFLFAEHLLTRYFFNFHYKVSHPFMWLGLVVAVLGLGVRVAAFFTCRSNFTHVVSFRRQRQHRLITTGIYSVLRHPGYTGFFYYSVFGQMFLGNWITMVGFFVALIKFFTERIKFEQEALLDFFPEYFEYKKKTFILIPFVKDPVLPSYYTAGDKEEEELGRGE